MSCDLFEREGLLQLERGVQLDPHFDTCPDCREARRVYTTLGQRIVVLDGAAEPSPVWKAGVWARIDQDRYAKSIAEFVAPGSADRRRWIRWVAPLGAVAAIALMALWLNQSMGKRSFPGVVSLTADIYSGQTSVRRGDDAHPGDELRLRGIVARRPYAELRVYFNDAELSAHCSAETSCVRQGDAISMTTTMRSLGTYRPVLIVSDKAIPAAAGGLDQDAAASLRAGALVQAGDPIAVR